ncbi:MAG: hypothetical protein JNM68_16260, partial [Dinghuibacter sp.]|nr:hypothetical protein [Dinghuibacter sp.]
MKQLLFFVAFCLPVVVKAQPAQTAEVLPGFQVKAAANGVTLSWMATDETHLHSYVVEYSSDGQTFSDMGMVKPT